jgi:DNA-directed RNA polymerase subunit H (RpoH/RPB5)
MFKKKVVSKKNKKVLAKKKVVSKEEPKIASLLSGCVIVDENLPKNKKSKKNVNTITWKVGSHKFTAELVNIKREY